LEGNVACVGENINACKLSVEKSKANSHRNGPTVWEAVV
jgi:hypothetical protein